MSDILNKRITLKLNKNWYALDYITIREAITMLCSESGGEKPGFAMDFRVERDEHNNLNLSYANPLPWEEWIQLIPKEDDLIINTSHGPIKAPLVVICANFDKIPNHTVKYTKENVRKRDNDTCQVSGRKLKKGEGNIGHLIAKAKGGKDTWENTVYMDKKLNTLQETKTIEEMGWKLVRKPYVPKPKPRVILPEEAALESHIPFLLK